MAREQREQVGRFERARRGELDERLALQERTLAAGRERYNELAGEIEQARLAGDRWVESHGIELKELTIVERELATRRERAYQEAILLAAHDPVPELERELGPRPESLLGAERWDRAVAALERYRLAYDELPSEEVPRGADNARRRAWERSRAALDELRAPERDRPGFRDAHVQPGELGEDLGPDLNP